MRGARGSGVTAILPRLVLLACVLFGVGLSYASAHLCGHATMSAVCAQTDAVPHHVEHMAVAGAPAEAGAEPFVLCLATVAATLIALVLLVLGPGRSSRGWLIESNQRSRTPAVRGSPWLFGLSLQRIAVLRI
ncbi:hypothetical protein [Rhizohabitans arisaemae]|uniref:hypothetical protein n=1 Tax=Rhizohabitans arisaemae TaxID=2720610 RepID=UPI0024B17248|nr:hypothetical protein [Rhizohabitans arisaemae]